MDAAAQFRQTGDLQVLVFEEQRLVRAVRSDPTYADAWANLSLVYRDQYAFDYSPLPDPLDRAFHAARRAIELDPTNQLPHLALAGVYFFRHELDAFLAEADRILRLNPNNASIVGDVADMLTSLDDERALALVTKAAKLDPFHPTWFNFTIAAYHFNRGQYEDALAAARKIDEPGGHWSLLYLAAIYAELDRQEEAQAAVEELQKLKPGYSIESRDRELRQWNYTQEARLRWLAALRKAGLPE